LRRHLERRTLGRVVGAGEESELRLLAAVRRSIREYGGEPSSRQVDELLDAWLARPGRADEDACR
jgi:hypothetical protein